MTQGTIIRALSGFYDVRAEDGALIRCRARGKFRLDGSTPLVGDRVVVSPTPEGGGSVAEILPRRTSFKSFKYSRSTPDSSTIYPPESLMAITFAPSWVAFSAA